MLGVEAQMIELLLKVLWFLLIPMSLLFIAFIVHIKLLNQYQKYQYDENYKTYIWGFLYWSTVPIFGLADILVNAGPTSLWFLELPKELYVTNRCKRHLRTVDFNIRLTRRQRLAIFIAKHLNYIAPGHL